ncbi:hypothetical protein ACN28S_20240 [Cystobacter fuscus]
MVVLTLRHGFVADAVSGYAWFGVITGSFFNRHREGMAFARLALGFVDRHGLPFRAGVLLSTHFCSVWVEPLARARELILEGLSHARQSGSTSSASYCGSALVTLRLAMGHPLDEVHQETLSRGEVVRKMGFVDPHEWLLVVQRYVQQLRGHTPSFQSLDGDGFEERAYEARMTPQRMGATRCHYWLFKLQSRYMCGAYEEAREAAEQVAGLLWATTGSLNAREGHFFRALALAACLEAAPPQRRQEDLAAIARHHQRLAEWAELCPENFRALERLVFAERARLEARSEEAIHAYEEAIRAAQESGATQYRHWPVSSRRTSGARAACPSSPRASRTRPTRRTSNGAPTPRRGSSRPSGRTSRPRRPTGTRRPRPPAARTPPTSTRSPWSRRSRPSPARSCWSAW